MSEDDALYICEPCERIGSIEKATEHTRETGHDCPRLSDAEAGAVRLLWSKEGRDRWGLPRLLDPGALARLARPRQ